MGHGVLSHLLTDLLRVLSHRRSRFLRRSRRELFEIDQSRVGRSTCGHVFRPGVRRQRVVDTVEVLLPKQRAEVVLVLWGQ